MSVDDRSLCSQDSEPTSLKQDAHAQNSAALDSVGEHPIKRPKVRRIVVAAVFLVLCIGIVFKVGIGTISSFGRDVIATVCPLGALETMVAAKLLIPQGLVFILIVAVAAALFGKLFCSWVCPVPSVRNVIDALTNHAPQKKFQIRKQESANGSISLKVVKPLTRREKKLLKRAESCTEGEKKDTDIQMATDVSTCTKTCGACTTRTPRTPLDSRHLVLGGALLSAAIFGFPVFCLICPIGLTFASIIAIVQLFGSQTLSWSLLLFPLILILELTVLRKWCSKICPLGALASLLSIPNRLFRPKVDMKKCLRSKGVDCQICTNICPEELDPHQSKGMQDCSKCRDCAVNCPAQAISFPFKS